MWSKGCTPEAPIRRQDSTALADPKRGVPTGDAMSYHVVRDHLAHLFDGVAIVYGDE
jgi:hypothetical protein